MPRLGDARRPPRLPAGPLLLAVEARGGHGLVTGHGEALERAYDRAKVEGTLTVYAADELAVRLLELPPVLVWGDDWFTARAEPVVGLEDLSWTHGARIHRLERAAAREGARVRWVRGSGVFALVDLDTGDDLVAGLSMGQLETWLGLPTAA